MSGDSVYGGIDVAKKSLEAGTTSGKSQKFCYTKPGLRQMTDLLKKEKVCLVVMEATGRLEEKAAHAIEKAGIPVAVVNPVRVRRFAQSEGRLAKTDRIDAEVIADFAEAMDRRGRLYTRFQKSEAQAEIDSLADRRRELVGMLAAEKSRLKGVSTAKARRSQERHLKWLQDEIDRIEKEIREAAAKDEETTSKIKLLRSVPGVGDVTATTLIGDLPELGQVSNQRIASLAGLAPFSRDSGQFRGKRMIMGGRVSVRCALYMAALAATRTQQGLRAFYLKLIAAGKPRKLALIAVARKLLVILNTVLGRGTPWQPETP